MRSPVAVPGALRRCREPLEGARRAAAVEEGREHDSSPTRLDDLAADHALVLPVGALDEHVGLDLPDERERVVPDEAGASLTPGNVRVLYNRECQARYDDGLACAPGYVYLGHELVHVFHALHGHIANHIGDPSDPMPGGSNHEEAWTIGRGAYAGTELTENALRVELELPLRVTHGSLCGPR